MFGKDFRNHKRRMVAQSLQCGHSVTPILLSQKRAKPENRNLQFRALPVNIDSECGVIRLLMGEVRPIGRRLGDANTFL
jgi:hypothetical protein